MRFRGIVQDALTRKYGALRGVVIAAAVFGIVHLIPQQVINAFMVGSVLGQILLPYRIVASGDSDPLYQ